MLDFFAKRNAIRPPLFYSNIKKKNYDTRFPDVVKEKV